MDEKLTKHIQDSIIYLLITDTDFCKIAASKIDPKVFTSEICRKLSDICISYFHDFGEAPKEHFNDVLVDAMSDVGEDKQKIYLNYLKGIQELAPNKEYVISKVNPFVKHIAFESGAIEFADLVSKGNYTKAENHIYDLLTAGIQKEDDVCFHLDDYSSIYQRQDEEHYDLPTGIKALDRLIGGYQRGNLILHIGGYKGKKTFSMQHIAQQALIQGWNVVYFSHEVSREELQLRFDMMFSKRASQRIGITETIPYYDERTDKLTEIEITRRSVFDKNAVIKARKAISRFGGKLVIKKYPMGQCTVQEMERYLNYLENFHNFVPDLIINDYPEIMDISNLSSETRDQINKAYIKMKGMADERNAIVLTASQVNASVLNKEKITMRDLSEDKRKSGNVDMAITFSSTEEKDASHIGKISVIAARNVEDGVSCHFSHYVPTGQFCVSSWDTNGLESDYMDHFDDDLFETT